MTALTRLALIASLAALPFAAQAGGMGSLAYDFPVLTWPQPTPPVSQGCADPVTLTAPACTAPAK